MNKIHKFNPILRCILILPFSLHVVTQPDILPTVNPQILRTPFCLCIFHACYMSSLFSLPIFVRPNNIWGTFIKHKSPVIKSARDAHYKSSPKKYHMTHQCCLPEFPSISKNTHFIPCKKKILLWWKRFPVLEAHKNLGYKIGNVYWACVKPITRLHLF